MNTSKKGIRLIAEICRQKGIRQVVFSPGSRSAPLVIAFSAIPEIECLVIPDERVAGYFALGMAQQLRRTVAVVCTSGTAVLNLGPAIAEAFYQNIPLLLLTADRPKGASEQGENQAIEQAFIFEKITKGSFDIDGDAESAGGLQKIIADTELALAHNSSNGRGPVHVNIRLSEPLYDLTDEPPVTVEEEYREIAFNQPSDAEGIKILEQQVLSVQKKLVIIGLRQHNTHFAKAIEAIARRSDTVVLTETASNTYADNCIYNYDACIEMLPQDKLNDFIPDIVITLGNQVISKRIRQLLRKNKPTVHWDISPENIFRGHNLFNVGVQPYFITENDALSLLLKCISRTKSGYAENWLAIHKKAVGLTDSYNEKTEFSDFTVFAALSKSFPANANIHYANSSPIRYSNFFAHDSSLTINANRGVSGIDGCVSTAAGAAFVNKKPTICISGDVGFFYDSNSLFNNNLSPDLRIIIINNNGGNIFRLIDGPGKVNDFEKFFETKHNLTAKHLALMYGIPYYFCDRFEDLHNTLNEFYKPQNNKPAILEISTNNETSEQVFKDYFKLLNQNK